MASLFAHRSLLGTSSAVTSTSGRTPIVKPVLVAPAVAGRRISPLVWDAQERLNRLSVITYVAEDVVDTEFDEGEDDLKRRGRPKRDISPDVVEAGAPPLPLVGLLQLMVPVESPQVQNCRHSLMTFYCSLENTSKPLSGPL